MPFRDALFHCRGTIRTGESLGFLCRYSAEVSQIALVSHKHDDNVGICVISKLLEPASDIVVGLVFADIIDEKSANSSTIIR